MKSIFSVLTKIKWHNGDDYVIFYHDRITNTNHELTFNRVKEISRLTVVFDRDNEEVHIPLHRIREVRCKEQIIWKR